MRTETEVTVSSTHQEHVAVVVVTFNSADLLPDLLSSLPGGFGDIPWQLVIVDNASSDDTAGLARRLAPGARVVETGRNAGYAAGINAGVVAAEPHTAVLVLNPDVRLGNDCVAELLRAVREPGVGVAVPRLLDAKGARIDSMRREPTVMRTLADAIIGATRAGRFPLLGEVVSDPKQYEKNQVTDWAEGSTQLISAECWASCGAWDESFFLYSEETEFGLRARDQGFATRYVPVAVATHLEGGSGSSPGLWALLVVNRVRLYSRRHGRLGATLFWLVTLLREAIRAAFGRERNQAAVRALLSTRRFRERPGPASVVSTS
jgi:GT2 family glycosyltransferase